MGVSSDGMLYFGFTVGSTEDEPPEWLLDADNEIIDFDDFVCKLEGLPESASYEERKLILDSCPVELNVYCSYDYPMYILSPKGCHIRVSRGYTEEISEEILKVDASKIEALKKWCEQNNIKYEEPKWLLCSMMG